MDDVSVGLYCLQGPFTFSSYLKFLRNKTSLHETFILRWVYNAAKDEATKISHFYQYSEC